LLAVCANGYRNAGLTLTHDMCFSQQDTNVLCVFSYAKLTQQNHT